MCQLWFVNRTPPWRKFVETQIDIFFEAHAAREMEMAEIGESAGTASPSAPKAPPQRTVTLPCPNVFMKLQFCLGASKIQHSPELYVRMIEEGLRQVFGIVGGAIDFQILKTNLTDATTLVKLDKRDYPKFRTALTMLGWYENDACAIRVLDTSNFLMSLATDSRHLMENFTQSS
ncbi:hypothetical protein BSKO_05898 [Bryopsis sp. KO-2023]|nr:hypothetical protein BSKO_05898 [Bryopsis sp. KO-2023]